LEILVLEIGQPVECCLHTVSLDDNPTFTALSYVWGDPSITENIIVNGHMKPVTTNLEMALRHIKTHWETFEPNRNFRLWADAVCIDQDNIAERASQVRLMGSIYWRSQMTFVWLGQDDEDTKDAFECARYIQEHAPLQQRFPPLALLKSAPFSVGKFRRSLRYLTRLTHLPWFERAWTFQEAILPSTVVLVRGKHSLPFEVFKACRSAANVYAHANMSRAASLILATREVENAAAEQSGLLQFDDLERLLSFRRGAKASDPRDIIFSLLGLFNPCFYNIMRPDYSISVKDVFTTAAKHIVLESGELRILCSVESPKHFEDEALPSWVPDWRASPENCRNVLHDRNPRSGYLATRGSFIQDSISPKMYELHLCGIRIGTVDQAGPFNDTHSISDFNLTERYTHTNQPIRAALRQAQTLNFDLGIDRVIAAGHPLRRSLASFFDLPTESHSQRQTCTQCPKAHAMPLLSIDEARNDPEMQPLFNIFRSCEETIGSRAFFTTNSSHLGFGPKLTAAGDQVFLLIGSDIPFVLRPFGEKFELVGACYVHGIMYGEGLHKGVGFDERFYPGSSPGSEWDFRPEVDPAIWTRLAGSVTESGCKVGRFLLREEVGDDAVLIEVEEIILK
jgi:hypothetical protein